MFLDSLRRRPEVQPLPPPPPPKPAPAPAPVPAPAARPASDRSSFEPPRAQPVALQSPATGEKKPVAARPADSASQDAQVQQVAQQVDAAQVRGGAAEAARVLRERVETLPPELASRAVQASKPTLDRITAELGSKSKDADGGMDTKDKDAKAFDAIVGDLAAVTSHVSTATDGSDKAAVAALGESVTRNLSPKDIGRFDEALGQAAANGQGTELGLEVANQLKNSGRSEQASDILENVSIGASRLEKRFGELADKVKSANQELGWLVKNYGPLAKKEVVQQAIDDFRKQHPEYQEIEALGGAASRAMDSLTELPPSLNGLPYSQTLSDVGSRFTEKRLNDVGSLTKSGQTELARLAKEDSPNVLDRLEKIVGPPAKAGELYTELGKNLTKAVAEDAVAKAVAGDHSGVRSTLASLDRRAGLLGVDPLRIQSALTEVDTITNPATSATERTAALGRLQDKAGKLQAFGAGSQLADALRTVAVVGGAVATAQSAKKAITDPSAENFARLASDTVGLGANGTQLFASIRGNNALANGIGAETHWLGKAGKIAGGVGVALDALDATKKALEGDFAGAGIGVVKVAGGAALLAGGAWTGPGIVLVAGATFAGAAYAKVQQSNIHENATTERFIQQLGVKDPEVARHLRNADSEGRSTGPVIAALADHLQVPREQLFDYLSTQPADRVLQFVKAAHGVDPDKDGRFQETADNDHNIIPPPPGGYTTFPDRTPHSLHGLQNWLEINGFSDAPGVR